MVRAILLHAYQRKFSPLTGEGTDHQRGKNSENTVSSPARGDRTEDWVREIMGKYLLKRILYGVVSIIIVVAIVMVMIYSLLNRDLVFSNDSAFTRQSSNAQVIYKYGKWEQFGYLDYVTYQEWLNVIAANGEIDEETRTEAMNLGRKPESDSDTVAKYVAQFTEYYESQGYTVTRLNAVTSGRKVITGGQQALFAAKDLPLLGRIWDYFTGIVDIDNIHKAAEVEGERGLTFTLFDPLYGGNQFAPAIIGNGTEHKYLLYFDGQFPFIHQNFATIRLGTSYSVNQGVDVADTMSVSQGAYVLKPITFPTGFQENSADDLHTAVYRQGSREALEMNTVRFNDDYTVVNTIKGGFSKLGYSFIIGILASIMAYCLGLPLGVLMALKKDTIVDTLGKLYTVFIIAVPSLAYIFIFKGIGGAVFKLPTTFDMESTSKLIFVLPIVSLALPSIANLMKWLRRYMVDQMNSDYVKFARSGGLSEGEIFSKHILKNAAIPIVHGIPGAILTAMVGAIITERVYVVPGAGNLLTEAINKYDNGVIVGVTLFYAVLSVASIILGDILMATVDPRISFTTKDR